MSKNERRENAEYIASICEQLAELAKRNGFGTGAYLLRVASLEFSNHARTEQAAQT